MDSYNAVPRIAHLLPRQLLRLLAATLLLAAGPATALEVGYYDMELQEGSSTQVAPITAAGHSPVKLSTLSNDELDLIDVLFVQNKNNNGYGAEYLSRVAAIQARVQSGLVLILHDRYITGAAGILPGGSGLTAVRNLDAPERNDLRVRDGVTPLTNGSAGMIDDTTLDGGTFSCQGYVASASLPAGAVRILTRHNPAKPASFDQIVTLSYPVGEGYVVYSTIPLDQFLSGGGTNGNFAAIYAPNVVQYGGVLALGVPDLAVLDFSDNLTSIVPGDAVRYQLRVRNQGPGDSTGATVRVTLPATLTGASWTCTASAGGRCAASGSGSVNDTVDLAFGTTLTYQIDARLATTAAGTLSVTATVLQPAGSSDPLPANNSRTETTTIVPVVDLALTKSGPTAVNAGDTLSYTLSLTNRGPATATGILLSDPTPAGLTLVSASAPCTTTTGNLSCALASLAAGASTQVQVTFRVPAGYAGANPLANQASVTATEPETAPASNTAVAYTGVGGEAVDLAVTLTGPEQVAAGTVLVYSLTASNAGPGPAANVTLSASTPAGLTLVAASAPCTGMPCSLGSLAAGAQQQVELRYQVAASYPPADPIVTRVTATSAGKDAHPGNDTASATTTATRVANLGITKDDGKVATFAGLPVRYTLVVSNAGPSDVTGATVRDTFPAILENVTWRCTATGGGRCTASGSGHLADTVDLPLSATLTYVVDARMVTAPGPGPLVNTASVAVPAGVIDPQPNNDSATDTDVIENPADLALTQTGPASVIAGQSLSYELTVTNRGPSTATRLVLGNPTPAGLELLSVSAPCTALPCTTLPDLAAGGSRTVTVALRVPASYRGAPSVANVATVSADTPDGQPANNTASVSTDVLLQADLGITKTDGRTTVVPGQTVTYTITVSNAGPTDAPGTVVRDPLPASLQGFQWSCTAAGGARCTASGSGAIADTVDLPAGGQLTYTLTATVQPATTSAVTNTATVTPPADVTDPNPGNNTAADTNGLALLADLALAKTDGRSEAVPGQGLDYTLVLTNLGPSAVTGATFTDVFPAALLAATWRCSGTGGAACPAATGSGDLHQTVNLPAGGTLTYAVTGTVSPAATGVLTNTATLQVPEVISDPVAANNSASDSVTLVRVADLSVRKTGPTTVNRGSTASYALRVANAGPSDARVTLFEPLPPGLVLQSISGEGAPCAAFPCTLQSLAAGTQVNLTVSYAVPADYAGPDPIVNLAALASDARDPAPADNVARAATAVGRPPRADLALTQRAPAVAATGSTLSYELTVHNFGPDDVASLTLAQPTPAGLVFVPRPGQPCGAGFQCTLGPLNAGASVTVLAVFQIPAGYAGPSPILNRATVSSTAADPEPGNNTSEATTTLIADPADLEVRQQGPVRVAAGSDLSYTATVTNLGPAAANNVQLLDVTPLGLSFASASAPCASGFPCFLGSLAPQASASVTITFRVPAGYAGANPIAHTVSARANKNDGNDANDSATAWTGVGTDAADLEVRQLGPATVTAGAPYGLTLSVRNLGPGSASATLAAPAPAGTSRVSVSPPCDVPPHFPCHLGELPPGSAVAVAVVLRPDPTLPAGTVLTSTASLTSSAADPVADNNQATVSTGVTVAADLAITGGGPSSAVPGTPLSYAFTVTNHGPSNAAGATVRDTFPAELTGVSWTCAAGPGASCRGVVAGNGSLNQTVDLAPGSSLTYSVTATVASAATGTVTNTASVATPAGLPDPVAGNNAVTSATALAPRADLAITKSVIPQGNGTAQVVAGLPLAYSITVTNLGPSDTPGVAVRDTFPSQLSKVAWTCVAAPGAACTASGSLELLDKQVVLPAGTSVTYTATALLAPGATGILTNTALVIANDAVSDPDEGNNTASDSSTILRRADLGVTKTNGLAQVVPGTTVTYDLQVSNAGPSHAPGTTVADTLPAALTATTWTCSASAGASCTASGSGNLADTVNLPAGASVRYQIRGTVNPAATGTLTNTATAGTPAGVNDPQSANNSATDSDPLRPSGDLAVALSSGQSAVVPGTPVSYTLTVTNAGPSVLTGATLTSVPPAVLENVAWTCSHDASASCGGVLSGSGGLNQTINLGVGGTVTYQLTAQVVPGATGTLALTASVAPPAGASDPNPSNDSATASNPLTPRADLAITKGNGQNAVVPGTPVSYTLTVTNAGPSSVTGAAVRDTFPAALTGVTWTCAASTGATCTASGKGNLNATADLPLGGSATWTVRAAVDPAATGSLANTATVAPPAGATDPETSNNSATDSDPLTPEADLGITKSDGKSVAVPGTVLTYTLTVTNAGPSSVASAVVRDVFPATLTGVTWTCAASTGATCTASGNDHLDTTATLPPGGTATWTVRATVNPAATGTVTNTATVTAPAGLTDRNGGNDSAADVTTLTPESDLAVTKTNGVTVVTAGQRLTYTVTVSNHGPSQARGATVSDPLPAALSGATWTCIASAGATCTASGSGSLTDSIDLAPGATATYTLQANLDLRTPSATLVNAASVTPAPGTRDPVAGNNNATDTDTVIRHADLTITKVSDRPIAAPDDSLKFTIVVKNTGPGDALGALVEDTFPGPLTGITWSCIASAGATCPSSGRGNISATVNVPAGGRVTFTAEARLRPDFAGSITNTATVTPPPGVPDGDLTNNQATATVRSTRIFTDGFESGDTSAWTATVPAP